LRLGVEKSRKRMIATIAVGLLVVVLLAWMRGLLFPSKAFPRSRPREFAVQHVCITLFMAGLESISKRLRHGFSLSIHTPDG
jgi:hypothetical protein